MSNQLRDTIDALMYRDEASCLTQLMSDFVLDEGERAQVCDDAAALVGGIRSGSSQGLMEVFLAEYGLSTDEGIALMCLAEALLRVPDALTIDALIEDKIASSDWGKHLGRSSSTLVNASTWGLLLSGKLLDDGGASITNVLKRMVKTLGEPVIRTAVARAMKEMGSQFVLGETINKAMNRGSINEELGYTYSYDMLGEAALTDHDARRYQMAYANAISAISSACHASDIRNNPGISVKLSALFPRYERAQIDKVMAVLVPRVNSLAQLAKSAGIGFNIDAEEADRLQISLDVIEAVLSDPALAEWDGFGVVVQAYGQRAGAVIDWLYATATRLDRKIMVRLVKGAYWDSEIKRAQVDGLAGFPVFTRKVSTDLSYLCNAQKLLKMSDRIYPQFATHNAHTAAGIMRVAKKLGVKSTAFEFQRLHGMGEALHQLIKDKHNTRCRIYAPVGAHRDLLAYLVRRLLENGANSSFVNQIVDVSVSPAEVASCPFKAFEPSGPAVPTGTEIFGARPNSKGFDLTYDPHLKQIETAREAFKEHQFQAGPLIASVDETLDPSATMHLVHNPANDTSVGLVKYASTLDIEIALKQAKPWTADACQRAEVLERAADLYEENYGKLFALLTREAGKTLNDCVGELREAVDFLRYYAAQARQLTQAPVGIFTCISPWNFPLAIFTGQIAGALATGNAVLAKPAEQTNLIAYEAVKILHEAGVPITALQLLPGSGEVVGGALCSDPRVGGVAFTGSTNTAKVIQKVMAKQLAPAAPLIAETGGINAMIVDSTALPEQAVRDVIASSFQSAGQRCSALRCLYVQRDVLDEFTKMLIGAMDELRVLDPWLLASDVGPVIDHLAQQEISNYISQARKSGRVLHELRPPQQGKFVAPTLIKVDGIADLEKEVFGPVLHIASYEARALDQVLDDINATGYGLTFGLHSRIDDRVQHVIDRLKVGNVYVNRNQIGAVVGSQPFGGEGLSGTGPKAGGPLYLQRFCRIDDSSAADSITVESLTSQRMPGPTGELNQYSRHYRAAMLCLGPGIDRAKKQEEMVNSLGGLAVCAPDLPVEELTHFSEIGGAIFWGDTETARQYAIALSYRNGEIVPLLCGAVSASSVVHERHLCVDTTASGGNAELLLMAQSSR